MRWRHQSRVHDTNDYTPLRQPQHPNPQLLPDPRSAPTPACIPPQPCHNTRRGVGVHHGAGGLGVHTIQVHSSIIRLPEVGWRPGRRSIGRGAQRARGRFVSISIMQQIGRGSQDVCRISSSTPPHLMHALRLILPMQNPNTCPPDMGIGRGDTRSSGDIYGDCEPNRILPRWLACTEKGVSVIMFLFGQSFILTLDQVSILLRLFLFTYSLFLRPLSMFMFLVEGSSICIVLMNLVHSIGRAVASG